MYPRSMYFDEDGDLAHEFYEEIKKGGKRRMKRIEKNLTPQVIVGREGGGALGCLLH